ncbi:MAG: tetratricopeptide repeat protein [Lachnospiraceae bacterium]|nr:tetratricopeptide repeat protein [Lachnospiraceae bacterium]
MIDRKDYEEPTCPFDFSMWEKEGPVSRIPVDRVLAKVDEALGRNDYSEAERLLLFWRDEAKAGRDVRGLFAVENELMGLYRKTDREQEAVEHAKTALQLVSSKEIGPDSTAAATAYTNAATVYKVFRRFEEALPLYEKAKTIYERDLKPGDGRMGGLYNNMALVLTDLKRCDEAIALYEKALSWMETVRYGALEQGMTYLNLCDCLMTRDAKIVNDRNEVCAPDDPEASLLVPEETDRKIEDYLDLAWDRINEPGIPANGYYAYICQSCAPSFRYYGRENMAVALERMAKEIYERD